MNLFGLLKYYKSNMRRFISIFASIALSVILVYMFQMLMNSITGLVRETTVDPKKYYSMVRQKDTSPNADLASLLRVRDDVEYAMPFVYWTTNMKMIIGGVSSSDILQVKTGDMDILIQRMGLHIKEGRKPVAGRHEILMHEMVAANKQLKIGDQFGSQDNKEEWISGSYTIVGIVSGKPIVSFASYETAFKDFNMNLNNEYMYGILLLPKKGELDSLNGYLDYMPNYYDVLTYNSCKIIAEKNTGNIDLLANMLSLVILVISSISVGFLCYIYITQRKYEFGLLWAIGYSRQQVLNRVIAEISGMIAAGLIAGLLVSILAGLYLKIMVYSPMGQPLELFSMGSMIKAFCVSLFALLFSVLPVWRMLKKLDPISIIEGVQ